MQIFSILKNIKTADRLVGCVCDPTSFLNVRY
jgi:hypothetical protein